MKAVVIVIVCALLGGCGIGGKKGRGTNIGPNEPKWDSTDYSGQKRL